MPVSAWYRAATSRGSNRTAVMPAQASFCLRFSQTVKQRPRRCTGWFKFWADEHAGDRTRHSLGEPVAGGDPRGARPPPARTRRPWLADTCRRRGRVARDMVGAGPELQPRDIAPDPQHCGLYGGHWRRPSDADSRARRDHADPAGRRMGLADVDPSQLRPRSPAARLLDPVHGFGRRIFQLLAAWRNVAAADRAWRCHRRRAGARPRGRVRATRLYL